MEGPSSHKEKERPSSSRSQLQAQVTGQSDCQHRRFLGGRQRKRPLTPGTRRARREGGSVTASGAFTAQQQTTGTYCPPPKLLGCDCEDGTKRLSATEVRRETAAE